MRMLCVLAFAAAVCAGPSLGAALTTEEEIALWPSAPPSTSAAGSTEIVTETGTDPARPNRTYSGITRPTLTAYLPDHADGTTILIAAGGRYMRVWADTEKAEVARAFNARGVTAFVLKYRLPGEGHADRAAVPLQDAQRAVRVMRGHAAEWGLDPRRIGVMGFSAGGHLAALLDTAYARQTYAPLDAADALSPRPNFAVLLYPVVTMDAALAHADSRRMLLGDQPGAEAEAAASPERLAAAGASPMFIALAADDATVDPLNSLLLFQGLLRAKVPAELHVFAHGGHGFAIDRATEAGAA
jgi:acetyl esterase/lipase